MITRKTRWLLAEWNESSENKARRLCEELGVPPLVGKLLVQRGYEDITSASRFLNGGMEDLHDPYLLLGMDAAVNRIRSALEQGEKVRIYGDYDADGVSSTSLLCHAFQTLGLDYDYYIPHRALEGYGLNNAAIQLAADQGVTLIVTVDTGISAYEEVEYAKTCGIDIVVTDHHEPPERIPNAAAVVNPKQEQCPYPFKGLAGVGVAFKLASALLERPPMEWTDIVSLGTVADLMPLKDENRIFVRSGLERMRLEPSIGFRALAEAAGLELEGITSTGIAFGMAPRINAAGRLDHAKRAVELLTAADYDSAILGAIGLDSLNKERQRIVDEMVKEADMQWLGKRGAADAAGTEEPSVILVAGVGWNVGVIGIVASKLLERYYKPVVVLGIDPESGMSKGSARSIEGFDLHAALTSCESLLDHYGGHQAAAGMSLHRDKLDQLEERLSSLAKTWLSEEDWIPRSLIDLRSSLQDATLETISQLALLEPFGVGNPSPRLLFEGTRVADRRAIGKESKHLKMSLGSGRTGLDVIGFGMGPMSGTLEPGCLIDLIGELSINEWNGQRKPQLMLQDLHYERELPDVFPAREQFGAVYQQLRKISRAQERGLAEKLAALCSLTVPSVRLMLDVFEELGFIEIGGGTVNVAVSPVKRELSSSSRYQAALSRYQGASGANSPA
ncbi:single-stranded-DNA-specific exonuclease RecJ [Paenibacillus sp. PAMC21692]|uniref:single-stranded-DNA-specific exonuclease RecJ n=1 Tax=Paenibacillus sp. PAMC21692 TaxID=2762320 RepID=UPI00164DB424|nr:single-stranded-DNA-specific exonuclease RecJ [Paenibacillus sp. PAMC21692]QNK60060.1 single-stranded-DNA-specific exonuclease RecJ [Paenibacillus sp. PAMC21692]